MGIACGIGTSSGSISDDDELDDGSGSSSVVGMTFIMSACDLRKLFVDHLQYHRRTS